ncbi:MAG: Stage V sporulation protein E (Required for spore cortex synthesis) [Parcubacteria group bacterium GW2011_GWA1_51_12]|nr:MAG: Stage V sporulation protein E (Required for spore cortex synthesis) [Parcubacteria group bacterium GW2011_GWA1_51_12]
MKLRSLLADKIFLMVVLALTVGGLVFLSSASVALSENRFGTIYYFSLRHIFAILVGAALFLAIQTVPYRFWKKLALPLMAFSIILLSLVLFTSLGFTSGGATRWLSIGPIFFQPSEIAKISLVLFLAWWFDRKNRADSFLFGFLPTALILSAMGTLLMLQPDLGTFLIIATTALVMYFVAGGSIRYTVLFLLLGVIAFASLALIAPYRFDRITSYLNPEADPLGKGYQVRQAAIAIGSGGFWGAGYGSSFQKQGFLPEPIGDSIFAVIAEEFGFLRAMVIPFLFLMLLWRGILAAGATPDFFSKLVVTGIITSIVAQAFVNMGSISGLLPLTGVPLPFISYGGTSLVATFLGIGIVYQIIRKSS